MNTTPNIDTNKKKLNENNYVIIPQFISRSRAIQLSSEFKSNCDDLNATGDLQVPNSYAVYNYISFLEILCEKTNEVSSIVEEQVLPTYAYSRIYLHGGSLNPHTDRGACEISITIHLNGDFEWPIFIKTPTNQDHSILLHPGDAMIYLGTIAEHWREPFHGTFYNQLFLHYVRSRGKHADSYFDKVKKEIKKEPVIESKTQMYKSPPISNESVVGKKMYNRGLIMTREEQEILHKWTLELLSTNKIGTIVNGRYHKTLLKDDADVIPLVFEIDARIRKKENLGSFQKETHLGDFVTIIPKNGFIHKHLDPNKLQENLFHVRFNVFITVPSDGSMNVYYAGNEVNAVEMSYVLCRSGIDHHWSDPNISDVPRISLSFGYLLPVEKIDELTSDPSIGTYAQYYPLTVNHPMAVSLNSIINSYDIEERGEKGSGIFTAANVLTDMQCDLIRNFIIENPNIQEEIGIEEYGNNVECKFITLSKAVSSNIPNSRDIDHYIFKLIGTILGKLHSIRPDFNGVKDIGYTLRKIYGGTKLHADSIHSEHGGSEDFVRCLSIIIVLNDDYDGGIFNFPNHGLKLKLKKGEAVLFPPYWTHPHSVTSVGEGQARYTINTWILEKFIG